MNFKYNLELKDNYLLVSMEGSLMDRSDAKEMRTRIDEFVASGTKHIIVNLSQIIHMNSSGLGALVGMLTAARNAGGDMVITSLPERIQKLLLMTKLTSVFNIADNEAEGLQQLSKEFPKKED